MHFKFYQISVLSTRKMSQMIIARLYCFVFIPLLAFGQSTSFMLTSYLERHYVLIVNHLNNKSLTYHCKSADNDFGNVCFTFPALHATIMHDVCVCVCIYICLFVDDHALCMMESHS